MVECWKRSTSNYAMARFKKFINATKDRMVLPVPKSSISKAEPSHGHSICALCVHHPPCLPHTLCLGSPTNPPHLPWGEKDWEQGYRTIVVFIIFVHVQTVADMELGCPYTIPYIQLCTPMLNVWKTELAAHLRLLAALFH